MHGDCTGASALKLFDSDAAMVRFSYIFDFDEMEYSEDSSDDTSSSETIDDEDIYDELADLISEIFIVIVVGKKLVTPVEGKNLQIFSREFFVASITSKFLQP